MIRSIDIDVARELDDARRIDDAYCSAQRADDDLTRAYGDLQQDITSALRDTTARISIPVLGHDSERSAADLASDAIYCLPAADADALMARVLLVLAHVASGDGAAPMLRVVAQRAMDDIAHAYASERMHDLANTREATR